MTDRWFRTVLASCIVIYAFGTWWNVHSQRLAMQPILDRMVAECQADRPTFEARYNMTCGR